MPLRKSGMCNMRPEEQGTGNARTRLQRLFRMMRGNATRAGNGERGTVAIMAALTLPVLVLTIGGALDYAQALNVRTRLQSAVDTALLATAKHLAMQPDLSQAALKAYFRNFLEESISRRFKSALQVKSLEFLLDEENRILSARLTASTKTRFLQLAGFASFDIQVASKAKSTFTRTEVALVLDVSSSMRGERLAELKQAVKDFLDSMDENTPNSPDAVKVAIVPFAQYVNVGMEYRNASWIDVPPDGVRSTCQYRICNKWQTGGEVCRWVGTPDGRHQLVCEWDDDAKICIGWREWNCEGNPYIHREIKWEGCVGSRDYPLNITDESYELNPVPGVMNYNRNTAYDEMDFYGYAWSRNHCPSTSILPLTSLKQNKDVIMRKVESLEVSEWTYIPAGLIWGWRVLSNREPFSQGADAEAVKRDQARKIIILMTDGENSRAPSVDIEDRAYKDHSSGNRRYANRITRELCNNIKQINPETGKPYAEIITITFNVNSPTAKKLMQECASMGSHDASSGELGELFLTIAEEITKLQLTE